MQTCGNVGECVIRPFGFVVDVVYEVVRGGDVCVVEELVEVLVEVLDA